MTMKRYVYEFFELHKIFIDELKRRSKILEMNRNLNTKTIQNVWFGAWLIKIFFEWCCARPINDRLIQSSMQRSDAYIHTAALCMVSGHSVRKRMFERFCV